MRQLLSAIGASVLCISAAWAQSASAPPLQTQLAKSTPTPERERSYIAIVDKARRDYAGAKSVDGRASARIGLQIAVHQFMGLTHNAEDWIGIYQGSTTMESGTRSLAIQIAPDVTVATWDKLYFDQQYETMVKPFQPLARVLDGLTIGDPVIFSANLLGSAVSTDEEMVLRPRIIAKFTKLKKLEDPAAKP